MEALLASSDFRNYKNVEGSDDEMEWKLGNKESSKIAARLLPGKAEIGLRDCGASRLSSKQYSVPRLQYNVS